MPKLRNLINLVGSLLVIDITAVLMAYAGQDIRRVGLSTFTDILNVVAPPISEHEVIQVWLSHDMTGYEGVETLVYRAMARVCILVRLVDAQLMDASLDYGTSRRR